MCKEGGGYLMNIDVQIHSWNLAGADFVPVNQIFRARVSQLRKVSATFRKEQMKCNRETISPLWNPGKGFWCSRCHCFLHVSPAPSSRSLPRHCQGKIGTANLVGDIFGSMLSSGSLHRKHTLV